MVNILNCIKDAQPNFLSERLHQGALAKADCANVREKVSQK